MESDSETFDTEGLSIMDINDIIGVQSEPVNDTLESEIDALSKIITESRESDEDGDSQGNINSEDEPKIADLFLEGEGRLEEESNVKDQSEAPECSKVPVVEDKGESAEDNCTTSEYESATSNQEDGNEILLDGSLNVNEMEFAAVEPISSQENAGDCDSTTSESKTELPTAKGNILEDKVDETKAIIEEEKVSKNEVVISVTVDSKKMDKVENSVDDLKSFNESENLVIDQVTEEDSTEETKEIDDLLVNNVKDGEDVEKLLFEDPGVTESDAEASKVVPPVEEEKSIIAESMDVDKVPETFETLDNQSILKNEDVEGKVESRDDVQSKNEENVPCGVVNSILPESSINQKPDEITSKNLDDLAEKIDSLPLVDNETAEPMDVEENNEIVPEVAEREASAEKEEKNSTEPVAEDVGPIINERNETNIPSTEKSNSILPVNEVPLIEEEEKKELASVLNQMIVKSPEKPTTLEKKEEENKIESTNEDSTKIDDTEIPSNEMEIDPSPIEERNTEEKHLDSIISEDKTSMVEESSSEKEELDISAEKDETEVMESQSLMPDPSEVSELEADMKKEPVAAEFKNVQSPEKMSEANETIDTLLDLIPESEDNSQPKEEIERIQDAKKEVDVDLLQGGTPATNENYIGDIIDSLSTLETEKSAVSIPDLETLRKEVEGPELDSTLELDNGQELMESEQKPELPQDLIFPEAEQEISPPNPEISELDAAVKFLQESEEQDSTLELASKTEEIPVPTAQPENSLFAPTPETDMIATNSGAELENVDPDPIAISEAEIISEAAKLESERQAKLCKEETVKMPEEPSMIQSEGLLTVAIRDTPVTPIVLVKELPKPIEKLRPASDSIPTISVLEDRLREPPQIEIPNMTCEVPISLSKSSLLISRDAKAAGSQKLESPRKDNEPVENIGSPRIILKIAKSAITDCSEPRSPKSPKIRSAADSPNPEDSPGQKLGKIKLKLSRGGHPSIISNENMEESVSQWYADSSASSLSPLGMKIKLSKSGDASVITEKHELSEEKEKHKERNESPIGMKIKLSKSGDAEIIPQDSKDGQKHKEKHESSLEQPKRTESPIGMKFKLSKTGDASIIQPEEHKEQKMKDRQEEVPKRTESPIGVKIKLSKSGDASIVEESKESSARGKEKPEELPKRTESPIGMKIKLSKSGDASIVHPESELEMKTKEKDVPKRIESPIGMKIKLLKTGDASIIQSETIEEEHVRIRLKTTSTPEREVSKKEKNDRERRHKSKEPEASLEMKIKMSKSGHATIVTSESQSHEELETEERESGFKMLHCSTGEMTIEAIQTDRMVMKRKDAVISNLELKKSKLEAKLSQMLPEVTIQPIVLMDQIPPMLGQRNDSKQTQMNIASQEISFMHVRPSQAALSPPMEIPMPGKFKSILTKHQLDSSAGSDCEIIEHRPELIIVNENTNSSEDVMIIDELPALKPVEVKVPKKRGRPRRNPLIQPVVTQVLDPETMQMMLTRDPLALDEPSDMRSGMEQRESERPRRTCRSQKSYAPPKRGRGGRGRGRGKRKLDAVNILSGKKARIEQDLAEIEHRTTTLISLNDSKAEGFQVLKQPGLETKIAYKDGKNFTVTHMEGIEIIEGKKESEKARSKGAKSFQKDLKDGDEKAAAPQNWLTPLSKKVSEKETNSGISSIQVIDEDTRMSAESGSRSQTPARNLAAPVSDTIVNEESQGSVISTATTESEKVKVKNRRMEINFDPDEGPFTVDKIAEYEWPLDRKGETFMIQEQISQYLGVKSFKRKYPDLKRRMVDMEERNYLRENGLVSESMCDMGLTAVCSPEVLDVMCSDFPEQYEEYRKHMREKQVKEHSKKQKELSAATNARIDLAEMAVQSALSWNANLNKSRQETRKCSLDLQTYTIHVPQKRPPRVDPNRRVSHYPVALIPGQYTDYYREYTPAELRYYPLNTVLYGPMRPNERKFDSQSEGSQSDSDSDSSSDDSSSSSSEGTQDTEESQSTMDEVDMEISAQKEELKNIKCKMCLKNLNKLSKSEVLIQCGTCNGFVHPTCIDLTLDMVPHIQAYAWQCTDCKTCAQCHDPADEDKMLFCDMCDRGYHIYCVGLRRVPQGRWHCQECAVCANCGSKEPGGPNADRNSVAQWQHEYKKGDKNIRVYVSTLCVPCSKLWRKGRYCPHCSRCHNAQRLDLETNLVHCNACDKYLHLGCVETKGTQFDKKNYLCDFCSPSRPSLQRPFLSKAFKSF